MSFATVNRRFSCLAMLGMLLVAAAVFGWGLQYKLSLYQPAGSSTRFAIQAKLLSQKERLETNSVAGVDAPSTLPRRSSIFCPALLLTIVAYGLRSALSFRAQDYVADDDSQQRGFAATNFFPFRPPPANL